MIINVISILISVASILISFITIKNLTALEKYMDEYEQRMELTRHIFEEQKHDSFIVLLLLHIFSDIFHSYTQYRYCI